MSTGVHEWVCCVKVATVWTEPASARELDVPGISNPVLLAEWLEALTYKERLALCDENRVQTQLLYGEPVLVEKIEGDWAKIIAVWQPSKKDSRGYPGWVPVKQLKKSKCLNPIGIVRVSAVKAQLWDKKEKPLLIVPFNTTLPVISEDASYFYVQTPHGEALLQKKYADVAMSMEQFAKRSAEEVIVLGERYLDLPYLWGGMSPYGYDCSGFSYNMLKACGYLIPRDASDQAISGEEISIHDMASWKKGDLLFFANDEGTGRVRHVGFYYGNGQLLHSPSTGKTIEIMELDGSKLEKEICAVRRYAV
ncbi:C40 family peptidase [Psychrobacillus lasiicapitis]|uniref:NlpC/P60 family protein n=1 Tax=Psychrobacillus lasiicapitis TaxID=1636719 RepID=A0A544TCK6_9BACI|nr:C40 family peptidase [Psychrobacillus lasiicapitis]TQR15175.1 NlpC/P60 family protein [Psychrobacillus lasiicapitis]GGA44703.1 gamma-D-glutamyl-L-lysine endopeptidase [Psychrobacillus lasiicapitis]